MKKTFYILIAILCVATTGLAEDKSDIRTYRHELRIGWGDQLFESLMWHKPTHVINTMPSSFSTHYKEHFVYSQHLWMEYQYRFTPWFALGAMLDGSGVEWDDVTRNGKGEELARVTHQHFYNLVAMPTVRFTYLWHPNVNLYSSLGLGLDINGGTETNTVGKRVDIGAAVEVTVLGVSANYNNWFCALDLGGMTALKNANTIFMACSRMINVSMGVRF